MIEEVNWAGPSCMVGPDVKRAGLGHVPRCRPRHGMTPVPGQPEPD